MITLIFKDTCNAASDDIDNFIFKEENNSIVAYKGNDRLGAVKEVVGMTEDGFVLYLVDYFLGKKTEII